MLGLLGIRGYRRLLGLRFATQWGDGMFQAALGGAVLFNPERQADPMAVAAGLAVLLMPYSVVGPFVGALLDRWDRRRVLVVTNSARVVLVAIVAAAVVAGVAGPVLYLSALAVMGFSRFVLAGLSVALPHVVEKRYLVEANTLAVTAGAGVAALGAVCAIGLRMLVGAGNTGSAIATVVAGLGPFVAAFVIGLAGQVVKLCADAAVQSEGPDGALGRIFALYDVVFNVGYVAAVALAAFAAPPNGWAPWLFAGASGLYLVGLLVHNAQQRRSRS